MWRQRSACSAPRSASLGTEDVKMPYIIGVAGSVAVGKSTTARVLQALLARWPNVPKVDLVTTDGFLFPNVILEREGLMEKKGFPESYDLPALLRFLNEVKAGKRPARAPIYSHLIYDVVPNQWVEVDRPDILIVEGLNVLQTGRLPKDGKAIPFVSDFFDFSVYIDADEEVLKAWYIDRFLTLRGTSFRDPKSYFHRYSGLSDTEAIETRDLDLGAHQSLEPAREHPADAPARRPHPEERARVTWSRKWRCGGCSSPAWQALRLSTSWPGIARAKTGVNALMSRSSTPSLFRCRKNVDARHKAVHDGCNGRAPRCVTPPGGSDRSAQDTSA